MTGAREVRKAAAGGADGKSSRRLPLLLALLLAALAPSASYAGAVAPAEILRSYVLEHRPWADVELRDLSLSAEPPAGVPRRIVVERGLPGRTVFAMKYADGSAVRATADVVAFGEVVVSARALSKDRPLEEGDVYLMRREVAQIPAGAVTDPKSVLGKTLSRAIGPNLPLLDRYVEQSALIPRGRTVTLVVENGGMRITATGRTRDNAYVNDAVRVMNLASRKTVTGILVDENTVRVEY
jgi:flagella basal body P-ring formation protein FlgA